MNNISVKKKAKAEHSVRLPEMAELVTIKGILVPDDWDEFNQITKMAICAAQEEEYLIEMDNQGRALIAAKGLKVVLKGKVMDTGKKRKTLVVKGFDILPW